MNLTMKTATYAQHQQRVGIGRAAGRDDVPITGASNDGSDDYSACVVNAWDSASVKRLKKFITAFRLLANTTNEPANERIIMKSKTSAAGSSLYIFNAPVDAEEAIRVLDQSGFDVKKLSLVGKAYDSEEHPVGFYTMGDRIRSWGGIGAFWGGIWGQLLAPAVFLMPGVGMVAMAGPFSVTLVAALEGAVALGGLPVLGAALANSGVPMEQVIRCEVALKADRYILMVHGTAADKETARIVLERAAQLEELNAV